MLIYVLGFLWFAVALPQPAGDVRTDAVVVLTGGEGRIGRGLDLLHKEQAKLMLVSGVDREVKPAEFAAQYKVKPALMSCCVTLGYESVDTRSNAREAARWIAAHEIKSVRLVTSDWHMRRAAYDLSQVAPKGVEVVEDGVPTRPTFKTLFLEYNKLVFRLGATLWNG
jgi:uncharacterized SAM-binding protein YcdF (DUF218 family)